MHELQLEDAHFRAVQCGAKLHEGRRRDAKRERIALGDCIVFVHRENRSTCVVEVTGIVPFATIAEMCQHHAGDLVPGANAETALDVYKSFGFSPDEPALMFVFRI